MRDGQTISPAAMMAKATPPGVSIRPLRTGEERAAHAAQGTARLPGEKWLLYAWMAAGPLAWAAVEGGWVTREVGRQPWLVYGLVKTSEAATPLPAGAVAASLAGYLVIAGLLIQARRRARAERRLQKSEHRLRLIASGERFIVARLRQVEAGLCIDNYIVGLGGRDVKAREIVDAVKSSIAATDRDALKIKPKWLNCFTG